jgi:hypothetical protein
MRIYVIGHSFYCTLRLFELAYSHYVDIQDALRKTARFRWFIGIVVCVLSEDEQNLSLCKNTRSSLTKLVVLFHIPENPST